MSEGKKEQAKFKLGQKVWYIADGYVTTETIKGILYNDDMVVYVFGSPSFNYNEGNSFWRIAGMHKYQNDIFVSRQALIKNINEGEYE